MFLNDIKNAQSGGLATAIPGELKGYEEAHRRFGKLPWKDLFKPAINLCQNGVPVSKPLAKALRFSEQYIRKNKGMSDLFINPNTGKIYLANDKIKLINLANTLTLISENGVNEFYSKSLAPIIVKEINENGGDVTLEDFKNYKVKYENNRNTIKTSMP